MLKLSKDTRIKTSSLRSPRNSYFKNNDRIITRVNRFTSFSNRTRNIISQPMHRWYDDFDEAGNFYSRLLRRPLMRRPVYDDDGVHIRQRREARRRDRLFDIEPSRQERRFRYKLRPHFF